VCRPSGLVVVANGSPGTRDVAGRRWVRSVRSSAEGSCPGSCATPSILHASSLDDTKPATSGEAVRRRLLARAVARLVSCVARTFARATTRSRRRPNSLDEGPRVGVLQSADIAREPTTASIRSASPTVPNISEPVCKPTPTRRSSERARLWPRRRAGSRGRRGSRADAATTTNLGALDQEGNIHLPGVRSLAPRRNRAPAHCSWLLHLRSLPTLAPREVSLAWILLLIS